MCEVPQGNIIQWFTSPMSKGELLLFFPAATHSLTFLCYSNCYRSFTWLIITLEQTGLLPSLRTNNVILDHPKKATKKMTGMYWQTILLNNISHQTTPSGGGCHHRLHTTSTSDSTSWGGSGESYSVWEDWCHLKYRCVQVNHVALAYNRHTVDFPVSKVSHDGEGVHRVHCV